MNGRERLQAVLAGRPTDRLAWTTLVDEHTLGTLPDRLHGMSCLEFYRYLGCDVVQLSGWGLGTDFASPRLVMPGVVVHGYRDARDNYVQESRCARGVLTSRYSPGGRLIEYPVKTLADIHLLHARWEEGYYQEVDDRAAYRTITDAVGEDGIVAHFACISVIPELIENHTGVETFYYLMEDHPGDMDALIRLMQQKELERFAILARHPCQVAIAVENTSTAYIAPDIYTRYNMPSQRAFVEAMHRQGKTAILHMCGHVQALLPVIKETGLDGIHALTPPPLGNTPWEEALDILGDDLIIFGCLVPDIFLNCPVPEMAPALDRLITPRLRASRFVLHPFADGISVPVERFEAVRDWVEAERAPDFGTRSKDGD